MLCAAVLVSGLAADQFPTMAGTSWRLSLNVGREPGTWMPKEWAASGARLAMPIDVHFSSVAAPNWREPLLVCYSIR